MLSSIILHKFLKSRIRGVEVFQAELANPRIKAFCNFCTSTSKESPRAAPILDILGAGRRITYPHHPPKKRIIGQGPGFWSARSAAWRADSMFFKRSTFSCETVNQWLMKMFDPIMLCGNLMPNNKQQYHPQAIRVHSWEKVKKDCEISCNSLNSRSRRCSWACTIWKSLIFINFHALKTSESELPNMAEMVPSAARLTFLACFTRAALVDETLYMNLNLQNLPGLTSPRRSKPSKTTDLTDFLD